MTYSCADFADSIIDALDVELEQGDWDSPSAQADLCIDEIERLQQFEKDVREALKAYDASPSDLGRKFEARIREIAATPPPTA